MFSHGSVNCLMTEKSVLMKFGPLSGARFALPSSPPAGAAKAHGLNQLLALWTLSGARPPCEINVWQPGLGLEATVPALFGSLIMSGRFKLSPLFWKLTPEPLELSTTYTGNPLVIFSMTVTCQLPRTEFIAPFQLLP